MSIGADMMKGLEEQIGKLSVERRDYERKWLTAEIRNKRLSEALLSIGEDPKFEDPETRPSAAYYRHLARKALILDTEVSSAELSKGDK